jgi:hypothetical protein
VVALTTEGHIAIVTADNHLLVVRSRTTVGEGGRTSIRAATTVGRKTLHTVRQRDALEKLSKRPAIGVSVQSDEIEVLSVGVHDPLHERDEPLEKLGFVHDDNGKASQVVGVNVVQVAHTDTRCVLSVVGRNLIALIPDVVCVLDDKDRSVNGPVL